MKIRSGFVSNSSSSSFCVYGAEISRSTLEEFAKTLSLEEINKWLEGQKYYNLESFGRTNDGTDIDADDDDGSIDMSAIAEFIDDVYSPNVSLHHVDDYDGGCLYIGRDSADIGDEETGKQFRESVNFLLKIFPDANIGWHEGEIAC